MQRGVKKKVQKNCRVYASLLPSHSQLCVFGHLNAIEMIILFDLR